MRFWKLLSKDGASSEEIGKELVGIETQLPEYKAKAAEAEEAAVRIRQMKLGGGKASEKDLADVERAREDGCLNVLALERSRDELRQRLIGAVAKEQQEERERVDAELATLTKQEKAARAELVKLAFTFIAKATRVEPFQVWGISVGLDIFRHGFKALLDPGVFRIAAGRDEVTDEEWESFRTALASEKLLSDGLPEGCLAVCRDRLQSRRNAVAVASSEAAAAALLRKLREQNVEEQK